MTYHEVIFKTDKEIESLTGIQIEDYICNVENIEQWNFKRNQVKTVKGNEFVSSFIDAGSISSIYPLIKRVLNNPNFVRTKPEEELNETN